MVTYKMVTPRYVKALIEHVRYINILTLLLDLRYKLLYSVVFPLSGASLSRVEGQKEKKKLEKLQLCHESLKVIIIMVIHNFCFSRMHKHIVHYCLRDCAD